MAITPNSRSPAWRRVQVRRQRPELRDAEQADDPEPHVERRGDRDLGYPENHEDAQRHDEPDQGEAHQRQPVHAGRQRAVERQRHQQEQRLRRRRVDLELVPLQPPDAPKQDQRARGPSSTGSRRSKAGRSAVRRARRAGPRRPSRRRRSSGTGGSSLPTWGQPRDVTTRCESPDCLRGGLSRLAGGRVRGGARSSRRADSASCASSVWLPPPLEVGDRVGARGLRRRRPRATSCAASSATGAPRRGDPARPGFGCVPGGRPGAPYGRVRSGTSGDPALLGRSMRNDHRDLGITLILSFQMASYLV